MNDNDTSAGDALSKSDLVLEFWAYHARFLGRILRMAPMNGCAEDIFQEACVKFLASHAHGINAAQFNSRRPDLADHAVSPLQPRIVAHQVDGFLG